MNIFNAIGSAAASLGGPIVSGLFGLGSSLLGSSSNKGIQKDQMAWQTSEREASQAYNTSERLASQEFQDQQRVAQNQHAIDVYNLYKSPAALVEQYKAAGLNPRLAMNSAGDLSAASGSSGSAPSGTHVQPATVGAPYQDINSFSSSFKSIAEGLSSLAAAKQSGVETYRIEQLLDSEVRSSQAKALMDEILTSLKVKYGDLEVQSHLKNLFAEINNKNANTDKVRAELDWLKSKKALTDKEVSTFDERFRKEMANLDSSTESNKASARSSDASAALSRAQAAIQPALGRLYEASAKLNLKQAATEEERTSLVMVQHMAASLDYRIRNATSEQEIAAAKKQYEALKQEYERIRNMYEHKNFFANQPGSGLVLDMLDSFLGSVGQVLSGAAVLGAKAK